MSGALAMLGVKFMGNLFGGLAQREQAKAQGRLSQAQNVVNKANIEANNTVREANNELGAAVGSLQRLSQALNNRQSLRMSGREQEAIQTNLSRAMKDLNSSSLESRLDTSYELGSLAATTAAAGVGGNSRDVMNATLRLTGARKQAAIQEQGDAITYDSLKMLTNTQADAYAQMDNSIILDQLDLSKDQYIPQFIESAPSYSRTFLNAAIGTAAQNPQLTQLSIDRSGSGSSPSNNGRSFQGMPSTSLRI